MLPLLFISSDLLCATRIRIAKAIRATQKETGSKMLSAS
jgi:hypothetical protein